MEKCGLMFALIIMITTGEPGARLQALGMPSHIQGESKVLVALLGQQPARSVFLSVACAILIRLDWQCCLVS